MKNLLFIFALLLGVAMYSHSQGGPGVYFYSGSPPLSSSCAGNPPGFAGYVTPLGQVITCQITAPATTGVWTAIGSSTTGTITYFAGDGTNVPSTGGSTCTEIQESGTILGWRIRSLNGLSGSIVFGVAKNGTSIVAAVPPTLTSGTAASGSVSTWTKPLAANDLICVSVTSVATLDQVQLTLTTQH